MGIKRKPRTSEQVRLIKTAIKIMSGPHGAAKAKCPHCRKKVVILIQEKK